MNCMCPADIRWDARRIYADSSSVVIKPKTEMPFTDIVWVWFALVCQDSLSPVLVFPPSSDVHVGYLPFSDDYLLAVTFISYSRTSESGKCRMNKIDFHFDITDLNVVIPPGHIGSLAGVRQPTGGSA